MRFNLLTPGMTSSNGVAFLFPLRAWKREIGDHGIKISYFDSIKPSLYQCDVVGIDCRYYSHRWALEAEKVEKEIFEITNRVKRSIWFNIQDSSGWDHARPLKYVTSYVKNQVLCNKEDYLRPIYSSGRIYGDYYNSKFGVKDESPTFSEVVEDLNLLKKIRVGWNSGLANYSLFGPLYSNLISITNMITPSYTSSFRAPSEMRSFDVSCRFGTEYPRLSVAWQRKQIAKLAGKKFATNKLRRRQYFSELKNSKIVISPFGLGEITLKDFETFLTGGLLIKPNMDHMETWPNFYVDGKTIGTFSWDLSDFHEVIEKYLQDGKSREELAANAQQTYKKYTTGKSSGELFSLHLKEILIGEET